MNYMARLLAVVVIALLCDHLWSFTLGDLPLTVKSARCARRSEQHTILSLDRIQPSHQLHVASNADQQWSSALSTQVLYQKVIRPSNTLPDVLFLGYLVEYLESHFQLPTNLPMVYECLPGNEETRCIVAWDSPLSPSREATRMEVEIVGIYTDKQQDDQGQNDQQQQQQQQQLPSTPNMAMLVVRKAKSSTSSEIPPMMQNLFRDSEKRIIKALDRGLEDFIAGKINFNEAPNETQQKNSKNIKTVEEALKIELVDSIPERKKPKIEATDVVFDAYAIEDEGPNNNQSSDKRKKPTADNVAAAVETMKVKAQSPNSTEKSESRTHPNPDFAVEAAKRKVAAKRIPKPLEDFAVAAARRVKEKQKNQVPIEDFAVSAARKMGSLKKPETEEPPKKNVQAQDSHPEIQTDELPLSIPSGFSIPDYMGESRAFRTTISRPKDRVKGGKPKRSANGDSLGASPPRNKVAAPTGPYPNFEVKINNEAEALETLNGTSEPVVRPSGSEDTGKPTRDSSEDTPVDINTSIAMPSGEQLERDIMKAAQDVMSEMAEQTSDMTPEELLEDVLKFGKEKEKEEDPGSGFVSAAFDKAKELMRQQHRQREAKMGQELGYKELDSLHGIQPGPAIVNDGGGVLSVDEELRRMFAAGERIADGRITRSVQEGDKLTSLGTSEEDIDDLIAKDRTVSKHARSLDEELTELELAINSSPGEEFDGPRQYPLFDIMSGPEVYNPNVDLDTVNYPGAMPGTRSVDLPRELAEAIRQADFAVEVLVDLKIVESVGEDGKQTFKYFAGERELTQEQVTKLETVAKEAIEIGIIKDPVKLADESSRLQMVVDELRDQPKERFREIAENFKDLLLSDNFVVLVNARLVKMADRDLDALRRNDESLREPHERERVIMGELVVYAQLLLKEVRALGAQLEAQQLEVVRSICQVAMDPKHQTEEEAAHALSDAVRDMRPLLDDAFVAYLKYAVAEEEARLARNGLVDDPEHNQWLFVLKIVQQGVYAEISKTINRYIEHIWYVLRMETPKERKLLLSKLIDVMPTMDVRPFVHVVQNIASSLGQATKGEFDGVVPLGEMTNKVLQLHRDVKDLLPPARIAEKSRDADEWAAKQKERLLEARKLGKQRLKNAESLASRQDEIEAIARKGEVERFD